MRRISVVVAVFVTLVIVGTACSKDSLGTSSGSGAPVALDGEVNDAKLGEVENGEVEISQDDSYFSPAYTKGEAGSTFTVKLDNKGAAQHTFTIDSLDIDEEVAPGGTAEVEVTLPADGAVAYYCRFHKGSGMQGAFYAKEGDVVSGGAPSGGAETTTTQGNGY